MQKTDTQFKDDGFQTRLSLFYVAIFLSIGCYLPYFALWLTSKGMQAEQVSMILAAPMIIRIFFAPLISVWADFEGDYRKILVVLGCGSLVALVSFHWASGFVLLILMASLNAIFWSAIIPLTETMALAGHKANKLNYGRARSWGSASFIIGSVGTGLLIDKYGTNSVLYFLNVSGLFIVVSALLLPRPIGKGRLRSAVTEERFSKHGIFELLSQPAFWVFLLAAGLGQSSHAFYYGFATLHWQSLGLAGWLIGTLWALGVMAEILLFSLLGNWLRQFNPVRLIFVGTLIAIFRWVLTGQDPSVWVLIPVQLMHAFSFGLVHLGAMYFITNAIPSHLTATAQGLNATMTAGILMGALVLASGPLYKSIGVNGFFVMAVIAAVGALLTLALLYLWDGKILEKSNG